MAQTILEDDELDRLMSKIREEIAEQDRRAAGIPPAGPGTGAGPAAGNAGVTRYRLKDLVSLEDEAFLAEAFRVVLGRAPNAGEAAYHLDRLRDGRLRKVGLVEELRWSEEGRKRAVAVEGLGARRTLAQLTRVPVLGPLARAVVSWVRLPRLADNVSRLRRQTERIDAAVTVLPRADDLRGEIARLRRELDARLDQAAAGADARAEGLGQALAERLDAHLQALAERLDAQRREVTAELTGARDAVARSLDASTAGTARDVERLGEEFAGLGERLAAQLDRHLEPLVAQAAVRAEHGPEIARQLGAIAHRLEALEQRVAVTQRAVNARATSHAPTEPAATPAGTEPPPGSGDALYAAFEDCFRGTREDILRRQTAHLPLLTAQPPHLDDLPVVDVGCGRGEWLELLRQRGIRAVGIDLNRIFLAENVARGLQVVEADALAYLRGQPDGSARAVTGFHIIEHLAFDALLQLLEELLRVLADGGVAVFETPNPENLITASHKFYYDPTHRNPIPPAVAAFLLRSRGFRDVDVLRLHENRDPAREELPEGTLRGLLYGPQDYAVVGYR